VAEWRRECLYILPQILGNGELFVCPTSYIGALEVEKGGDVCLFFVCLPFLLSGE
jgi:hypothetical protein